MSNTKLESPILAFSVLCGLKFNFKCKKTKKKILGRKLHNRLGVNKMCSYKLKKCSDRSMEV